MTCTAPLDCDSTIHWWSVHPKAAPVFLMTTRLWRALQRPPIRNPVFVRAYDAPEQPTLWYIGCAQWFGILFFLPILAFPALIYGIGWAAGVSNLISKERAQGTFDLIRLCPSGPLGMTWALCAGYLYHHRTFNNINERGTLYWRTAVVVIALVSLDISVSLRAADSAHPIPWLARVVTLIVALLIEHRQSLIIASLSGMLAPFLTGERVNAQLFAFALYLLAQMATYMAVMVGFTILSALVALPGLTGWFGTSVMLCLRLGIFLGVRDALIRLLWRALGEQLALAPVEQTEFLNRYAPTSGARN